MKDLNECVDYDNKVYPDKRSEESEQPIFGAKEHALFYEKEKEIRLFIFFHNGFRIFSANASMWIVQITA